VEDQEAKVDELTLKAILLDPKGQLSEFRLIQQELAALQARVADINLAERKEQLLQNMSSRVLGTARTVRNTHRN